MWDRKLWINVENTLQGQQPERLQISAVYESNLEQICHFIKKW